MTDENYSQLDSLDVSQPIWERFFTVSPLVLIGTREENGTPDLAPKHMAFPMGWENFFGFVCTPRHATYANAVRSGGFAVSYPRASDVVMASLAASPRCDDAKPVVGMLETFSPQQVAGVFVKDASLFLECELERTVDGFGSNSLIVGRVVAAYARPEAVRGVDRDDGELLLDVPQLVYLHPGRFAVIEKTEGFPFPAGMRR